MRQIFTRSTVFIFVIICFFNLNIEKAFSQCPSTGQYSISSNINWTAITGIATCSPSLVTANSTFNGNVNISYSGANRDLTFNVNNLTINGNLNIQSTANGNTFKIADNTTLIIIGDLGDPTNNNISYILGNGSVLIVTGTLYGKNGNTIGGTGGVVSVGAVNFTPGNLDCSVGGCPVLNITNCNATGTACASNNGNLCGTNIGGTAGGTQFSCSSFNPTTLTLTGYTGRILRWEKSIDSGLTWSGLGSVSANYLPPTTSQTTIFRAVVSNTPGSNCISYSSTVTISVNSPPAITTQPSTPITTCSGSGTQTLSVIATGTALSYDWKLAGVSVNNAGAVSGQGTATLTLTNPTATNAGSYTVVVTGTCPSAVTSTARTVTINNVPTISGTTPNSRCGTGTVSIGATASAGTINWYTASTGGPSLGTGPSFTTPSIATTTTYYVDAVNTGCTTTTRTAVVATVNPIPTAPTGTATQSFCAINSPTVANLNATGLSIQWYAASTGGTALATSIALTNGTHYYASQTVSGCESATRFDVIATVNNPTAPTGTAAQSFCAINGPTVANLNATGTAIQWYAASTGGTALATSVALTNGTHYYASQTVSGCESATRFDVIATVNNPTAPTGTAAQSFCAINSPTVANLNATGLSIQWYAASTGGSALSTSVALTNGTHYYASQTVSGCESATRFDVTTTVNNPTAPTGIATQFFCAINSPTVANLNATGLSIQWYAASTGGTALATSIALTNGTHYYASQTVSGCESATRFDVIATVNNTTAPTGTAAQSFCAISSPTVANLNATGTAIQWYAASTGGTPLATSIALTNGTHYYASQTVSGCESATRFDVTATVNNPPSTPTISAITNPTCSTATGSFTITNYSGSNTYIVTPSTGVTISTNTVTAPEGSYTIYATSLTCDSATETFNINAQPSTPTSPSIGTITQPSCSLPTGSVILSGLPSGSWTLNRSGTSSATTSGTGSTTTISGLAVGTYAFTVSDGTCTSTSSGSVVINNPAIITNTWSGSWDNGTPTLDQMIVFASNYSANADVNGCSCMVNTGVNVIIQSDRFMKIVNQIQVSGSLTFEENASLIQMNDTPSVANSGNITYKRNTTLITNLDYTYWSSPVANQKLVNVSPGTLSSMFYSFNASGNSWVRENNNNIMSIGKGYIIRGPESFKAPLPPGIYEASFIGVPNNGIFTVPIIGGDASNLIGNPYPSAVDADAFLLANKSIIEGTLYFWTHNTAIQLATNLPAGTAGSGKYAYTSDDYATYNYTGGTSGAVGTIAAGQGFMATGLAGGTANFNNSMRLDVGGVALDNSIFFKPASISKTGKASATTKLEKNRIWLNLYNSQGAIKQTLIGYITGATNQYDKGYDGISYDGNSFIDFYSISEKNSLTIQGRALPFDETDVVPLGYSSTIDGEFSISIDKADGLLTTQKVFLEDKLTNTIKNLKESPYTFTTKKGTFNDRFVISYKDQLILGIEDFETADYGIIVSHKGEYITIQSSSELINSVLVYDISGKLISQKNTVNSNEVVLANITSSEQVLLVKVILKNGKSITKKVIY